MCRADRWFRRAVNADERIRELGLRGHPFWGERLAGRCAWLCRVLGRSCKEVEQVGQVPRRKLRG